MIMSCKDYDVAAVTHLVSEEIQLDRRLHKN